MQILFENSTVCGTETETLVVNMKSECCYAFVPLRIFCFVTPIEDSLDPIALCTIVLFVWHFLFNFFVIGLIHLIQYEGYIFSLDAFVSMIMHLGTSMTMIWVSILLVRRKCHLLWLAYAIVIFTIQFLALTFSTVSDIRAIAMSSIKLLNNIRVLAIMDLTLTWIPFTFNWCFMSYFWLCVFSRYQLSRLPEDYEEQMEAEEKENYLKRRSKVTDKVVQEMIQEAFLEADEEHQNMQTLVEKTDELEELADEMDELAGEYEDKVEDFKHLRVRRHHSSNMV